AKTPPPASRVQATQVPEADDPMPRDADVPDDVWQDLAPAPAASPPEPAQRRPYVWGRPPGVLPEDLAPANAGLARSPAIEQGRSNAAAAAPELEVGGYQVYYDLRNENRLRAW